MEAPPKGGSGDIGQMWPGKCGSVCFGGEWEAMDSGDSSTAVFRSVVPSSAQRLPLSSRMEDFSSTSTEVESRGLACDRSNLNALGLPQNVIFTIQSARVQSTRKFETWCQERQNIPFLSSVPGILTFLQEILDEGKAFSIIKVYLAAISSCHMRFNGETVSYYN